MNPKAGRRVLIAEDDFLVSEMIAGLVEEVGHTVVGRAASGREAFEMARSLRPDVILMDIAMPDTDGIEATRQILAGCPAPVVIVTAFETPELVARASAAGVGAYLVKPTNAQEMERAIVVATARSDDVMELRRLNSELQARNNELQEALANIKVLSGLLPICASCKRIRDDQGYWQQVEIYIRDHSEAEFSHGLCPDCARKLFPTYYKE